MEGLGQDVWVHVPDGAQGGWDGGAVGIQGTCINVLAINRKYSRSVSLDATKQECESKR